MASPSYVAHPLLCDPDLIKQIGVTIQHLEQLHQREWRPGLAVLVAGEGMVALCRVLWRASA
jgi:hypothetical protein